MKMQEIRDIAKIHGIKTSRMTKQNLIREIQTSEGNFGCFATPAQGECDQPACMWRQDCLKPVKKKAS